MTSNNMSHHMSKQYESLLDIRRWLYIQKLYNIDRCINIVGWNTKSGPCIGGALGAAVVRLIWKN
jgi:hypothetical protein